MNDGALIRWREPESSTASFRTSVSYPDVLQYKARIDLSLMIINAIYLH